MPFLRKCQAGEIQYDGQGNIICDASNGPVTVMLPNRPNGNVVNIERIDNSEHLVQVQGQVQGVQQPLYLNTCGCHRQVTLEKNRTGWNVK